MNYRRNHDGYYDPTAGDALEHIVREERRRRRLAQKRKQQPDPHPEEQKPRRQRYVNIGRHRRF